jgi:hypothetical protein
MDELAFPWQADWYRSQVRAHMGGETDNHFRLWYSENSMHNDCAATPDETHVVSYLGMIYQALTDIALWVEKDIAPPASNTYEVKDGQVVVPPSAKERNGVQPTVKLLANGKEHAVAKIGEGIYFSAEIDMPYGAGKVTAVEWSFNGEQDFPVKGEFRKNKTVFAEIIHPFAEAGAYFPTIRIKAERNSEKNALFTQVMNISRVRVVVNG